MNIPKVIPAEIAQRVHSLRTIGGPVVPGYNKRPDFFSNQTSVILETQLAKIPPGSSGWASLFIPKYSFSDQRAVVVVVVSVSCNGVQPEAAGQLGRSDFSHCIIFNKDPPIVQPDCPISSRIFLPRNGPTSKEKKIGLFSTERNKVTEKRLVPV